MWSGTIATLLVIAVFTFFLNFLDLSPYFTVSKQEWIQKEGANFFFFFFFFFFL